MTCPPHGRGTVPGQEPHRSPGPCRDSACDIGSPVTPLSHGSSSSTVGGAGEQVTFGEPRCHGSSPPRCCHHPAKPLPSLPQDVVNCVGGMGVLLPLLEQVVSKTEEPEDEQETNDLVGPELTSSRNAQGMLIPLGKSSGEKFRGCEAGAVLLGWLEVTTGGFLDLAGVHHGQEKSFLRLQELRGNGGTTWDVAMTQLVTNKQFWDGEGGSRNLWRGWNVLSPNTQLLIPKLKAPEASISLNLEKTGEQGEKFGETTAWDLQGGVWVGPGAHGSRCPAESRLERNSVAAFLLLVKNFLRNHAVNQESLVQCHGPAIIGALLHKVGEAPKTPPRSPCRSQGAGSVPLSPVAGPWHATGHERLDGLADPHGAGGFRGQRAPAAPPLPAPPLRLPHLEQQRLRRALRWEQGLPGNVHPTRPPWDPHTFSLQVTSSTWPAWSRTTSSASARSTGCSSSWTPSGPTTGQLRHGAGIPEC